MLLLRSVQDLQVDQLRPVFQEYPLRKQQNLIRLVIHLVFVQDINQPHLLDSLCESNPLFHLLPTILDKINEIWTTPPTISVMPNWRVFAPSRFRHCFRGDGG